MSPSRIVNLLTTDNAQGRLLADQIGECFEKHHVKFKIVYEMPVETAPGDVAISLLDLQSPTFHDLDETTFQPFMTGLLSFRGCLIWVTPSALTRCKDPRSAMAHGVVRTARMESGLDVTIVEVDEASQPADLLGEALWRITGSLPSRQSDGSLDPDYDYIITDGVVQIPRAEWFGLQGPGAQQTFTPATKTDIEEDAVLVDARNDKSRNTMPQSPSSMFRSNVTYLLVGGTGGIGRSVAIWMAENGAQSFISLSRSAADPKHEPFLSELESYPHCRVQAMSGDVSILADVQRALALAPENKPVAGVVQLSLVLCVSFQL